MDPKSVVQPPWYAPFMFVFGRLILPHIRSYPVGHLIQTAFMGIAGHTA